MSRSLWMALNDLRLTIRDRTSFIWMLIMPIAFMWFFGQMGGGGGGEPDRFSLAVIDRDGGWLARALVGELQGEKVQFEEIESGEAPSDEPAPRTLVIPEGFTEKVVAGEQQMLRLEIHPDASEEYTLAAQVHVTRTIVRTTSRIIEMTLGGALREGVNQDDPDGPIMVFRKMGDRPLLVRLEVSTAGSGRPVPRGFAQSVPGILTMMVLMMTLIYGGVFLTMEKRAGMLRRQGSVPMTRGQLFAGKLMGRLLVAGTQIVVLVLAGRFVFGLSLGRSFPALVMLLCCYAAAVASLSTLLGVIASTPEQASAFGWILSMVLGALGGCWWPSEVMPRWLWSAAHVFPTAWAMDAFHALISFGRGVDGVLIPCLALLGFGLLFGAAGARLLRPA